MYGDMREMASGPGVDSRQWCSYGQVIGDANGSKSIRFNDEEGAALAHGVLIDVKLEPSRHEVPCRVLSSCAGNGEGEYHPFVAGDEVMVLVPEGNERAGCVIIGRLNNKHDVFPQKVAGMDVTQNNVGFKRHVFPFVVETSAGYTIRNAVTGSSFTIDQSGQVFITEGGTGAQFVMSPDVVSLMLNGSTVGFQIDVAAGIAMIKSNTATLVLDDGAGSKWQSTGTLSFSPCGNPGLNHVTTIEAVCQILQGFCAALAVEMAAAAAACAATPLAGGAPGFTLLASLLSPGASIALLEQAIPLAATPTCSFAPLIPSIQAALIVPKVLGENAGVGSPGLLCD